MNEKKEAAAKPCSKCGVPMKWQVDHWMCMNPDCSEFSKRVNKNSLLG